MMLKRFCTITENQQFLYSDDEQTDFSSKYHVVAFSRFVNDGEIKENFSSVAKDCWDKQKYILHIFVFIPRQKGLS